MTSTTSTWRTRSLTTPVYGLSALAGIEANIWKHVSLTVEYVFNDISDAKKRECRIESVDSTGLLYFKSFKYTEHVGVPSQIIRFGARFTL
jgi:opacity protein-like surface antigen